MLATLLLSIPVFALASEYPVEVTLLDAGSEPRQELRYAPVVGDDYYLVLKVESTESVESEEVKMEPEAAPTLRLRGRVVTDEVTAAGHVIQHIDGFDYEYEPSEESTSESIAAMNSSFEDLRSVRLEFEYDLRGRLLSFELHAGEDAEKLFLYYFDDVRRLLATQAIALPLEAIGIGARWSVSQPAHIAFVEATETRVFEWVSSEEGTPSLGLTVSIQAEEQKHRDYVRSRKRHTLLLIEHKQDGLLTFDDRFLQAASLSSNSSERITSSAGLDDQVWSTKTFRLTSACAATEAEAEMLVPRPQAAEVPVEQQLEEAFARGRAAAFREIAGDLMSGQSAETHKGYGDWYHARGALVEAATYYLIALERDPELNIARYRLACVMAGLDSEGESGLNWLESAVEAGFWGFASLKDEPAFARFHETERYKQLSSTVQERYTNAVLEWKPRSIVRAPESDDPAAKFPVLVFLHGYGDQHLSYADNAQVASENGYVGLAVSGTVPFYEDSMRWNQLEAESTHDAIQVALKEHASAGVPIDESRIFLVGFSQGALHATKLLALYPDSYSGGIALSIGGQQDLVAPTKSEKRRPLFGVWGTAEHEGNIAMMKEARDYWQAAGLPWREHTHDGEHHFPADWEAVFPVALEWLAENQ